MTTHLVPLGNMLPPGGVLVTPDPLQITVMQTHEAVMSGVQFVAWVDQRGRGKSVASTVLIDLVRESLASTSAVPSIRIQLAGDGERELHRGALRGIYGIYRPLLGIRNLAKQRDLGEEGMANEIVDWCRLHGTRLMICDEAGSQSPDQLSGLATISDEALKRGIPLTMLLVGMKQLTDKLNIASHVGSRTSVRACFPPWSTNDQYRFVAAHCPQLAQLGVSASDNGMRTLVTAAGDDLRCLFELCRRVNALIAEKLFTGGATLTHIATEYNAERDRFAAFARSA